ncbi:MAG: tetratricopeptide repeat protein [bacterium]
MCGLFRRTKPDAEARKARDALADGRAEDAVEHCQTALKADPDHADCRTLLARAYERLDRVGDAIEAYEAACEAAPSYPNFLAAANLYASAGEWERAEAKFQAAVETFPTSVPAWKGLADARRRLGKLDQAVQCLEMIAGLQPDDPEAQLDLAEACAQGGDVARATELSKTVLDGEPDNPRALHCLANCHAARKQWDDAIAAYRHLLRLVLLDDDVGPAERARLHYDLACALRETASPDEALTHLAAAQELQPNFLPAYRDMLEIQREREEVEAAMATAERALEIAPDEPGVWHDLGRLRLAAGQPAAALEAFARAIELRPGYTEALCGSAEALAAAGQHDRAIALCEKLVVKRAFQALPHLAYARVLRAAGDLPAALRHADIALGIAPTDPEATRLQREIAAEAE